MKILGLTGSIAMGKSETSRMFRALGVPVFDADKAVHELYAKGGAAIEPLGKLFPDAIIDGAVDREQLGKRVLGDEQAMKQLEAIVHPLVREMRVEFIETARKEGHMLVVLDIPLLFETGYDEELDAIVVVSAPYEIQRERVLNRPGMTEEKFQAILSRQVPDAEKRKKADFIVDSSQGLEHAAEQVDQIVRELTQ
ncbi:MAG: dephospho-CoA kinase [Hyphomicrobiales bacterium]